MRLWSVHPSHLDSKGLVALWREGLLARHVLHGKTKGYKNHPQLARFKAVKNPKKAIDAYLHAVVDEAEARGYSFDRKKLGARARHGKMRVTLGQMEYETKHLKKKLSVRDPARRKSLARQLTAHPLFRVIAGDIEDWERQ